MKKLWLLIIILFAPMACQMETSNKKDSFRETDYLFVKSCLHHKTGLARRLEGDRFTTPYANALAAMALIHENDLAAAEKIFHPFQLYFLMNRDHFNGLPQSWNVETGLPDTTSIHWEGDSAFLLLALNYYVQVSSSDGYQDLIVGLTSWLSHRANSCELIVAEGVADIYAALAPFFRDRAIQKSLERLHRCFFSNGQISSMDYQQNLNHIIRGALVFGDTSGFSYLNNFLHAEAWDSNCTAKISGYQEFAGHRTINVEVSTQILLALKIWQLEIKFNAVALCDEIERRVKNKKQLLLSIADSTTGKKMRHSYCFSALEPVCYLLFYYWNFNPFAPGEKSAVSFAASKNKKN